MADDETPAVAVEEGETPDIETEGDEELVVSIGEEAPPQEAERAPEWVRELRKSHRELQKRNRELESKLSAPAEKKAELGPKPKLEDFDYDEASLDAALDKWHDRKREIAEETAKAKSAEEDRQTQWQAQLASYETAKAALKVRDFEEAEASAMEVLDITQQGVILDGAKRPELVIYALGRNPAKAKELASISNPVKFAFAVSELESQLKVGNRNTPAPEKAISGSTGGAVDNALERLRAEAAKSGDYTKVLAHKRKLREG